jgi:DNA repair exonuclease SbcCD ATPase subunit
MSFENEVILFKEGLYFISGNNLIGGDSNGSGKSAILSGICWAIFGRTQNGLTSEVKQWSSKKDPRVTLVLWDIGVCHDYAITRTSLTIDFQIDGEKVKGLKSEVQAQILKALNTDFLTFVSCDMFTKGQVDFLADSGDAAKKKLFKAVLGLDRIDKAYKFCKDKINEHEKIAQDIENSLSINIFKLNTYREEVIRDQSLVTREAEEKEKRIEYIQQSTSALKPEPVSRLELDKIVNTIKGLENEGYSEQLAEVQEQKTSLHSLLCTVDTKVEEIDSRIKNLGRIEVECPTCGSTIGDDNEGYKKLLDKLPRERKTLSNKRTKVGEQIENLIEHENRINGCIAVHNNLKKQHMKAEWEYDEYTKQLDHYTKMIANQQEEIENIRNSPMMYEKMIEETEEKIVSLENDIRVDRDTFEIYKKAIDHWSYLSWVFSRQGVVGHIVDRSFKRLETLTNRYLKSISKEEFVINISPQRELKSGEFKEEIDISVFVDGEKRKYDSLSSGQRQRINVAMLVAIYMWCREIGSNPFDFMLLDEVLDLSLAERGQEDVCGFISSMLKDISQIIVISHRDGMQSETYKEIHVVRDKNGISSIKGE